MRIDSAALPATGFNTQPPEGGWLIAYLFLCLCNSVSTHSRPKAAGLGFSDDDLEVIEFQHTAARRRLGLKRRHHRMAARSFNTQPPEGGWQVRHSHESCRISVSTHSRPKAAGTRHKALTRMAAFQHTAARRRLGHQQQPY